MIRWALILTLVFFYGLSGCGRQYTYTYYEVVHSPAQVQPGADVRLVSRQGSVVYGKLEEVGRSGLTVVGEGGDRATFSWDEIRVLEKVKKETVRD